MQAAKGYQDVYWVSGDGLRLHARAYLVAGKPSIGTVVCIPGLTRNASDFGVISPVLTAAGWQVLAVDLRGRAGSERARNRRSYNPRIYAEDVAALLDEQGIRRAVFLGTSLGALVTMMLAIRHRDLIVGSILNDAGPQVPKEALDRITQYAGKALPAMTTDAAQDYVKRIASASFPHYRPDQWAAMVGRLFRRREDGLLELDYDPAVVRTTHPWVLWLLQPLLWRAWRSLAACGPTLVVRGALSDVLPADVAERMINAAPTARLVEVASVGHAPMLDEPEAMAAILELLRSAA